MHQNDTLMKKLQQTTDMAGHTGRNRPIISPETFLPWNERSRTPRLPSSPRTAPASDVHRRPALPNRWTPAPSMHSLSPATSTSSEETDRSQQYYDGRRSQAVATDLLINEIISPIRLMPKERHENFE
ncbi:unnamed protein product [Cylicostephanus goldi]|uniref:Uncharacterized protein n=1 Tax=Cylicostephanus goldi TaxID=71465 RepID=A0A3P6TE62_CYLGO|nr:unnamed protein product [Cylicostephanus goldi]